MAPKRNNYHLRKFLMHNQKSQVVRFLNIETVFRYSLGRYRVCNTSQTIRREVSEIWPTNNMVFYIIAIYWLRFGYRPQQYM